MSEKLAKQLEPLVAEAVASTGFELEELDLQQSGHRKLVKAVVDGDDGVELDQVAEISRAVSAELDAHDHLIAGTYTLEVTSPGLDRPLTRPRHWRRARNRLVRVIPAHDAEFVGRVGQAGQESVRMLVNGALHDVAYADVDTATIEVEFKQPPVKELKLLEDEISGTIEDGTESKEEPR